MILLVRFFFCFVLFLIMNCLLSFLLSSLLQLDKIVQEKEAQFNEEKNKMWKELTDAFQKVVIDVGRTVGLHVLPVEIHLDTKNVYNYLICFA